MLKTFLDLAPRIPRMIFDILSPPSRTEPGDRTPAPVDRSTEVVQTAPEPIVVEMLEPVSQAGERTVAAADVDYDTQENRTFGKDHPRFGEARDAAIAFTSVRPRSAREIADHIRGDANVPEFLVPSKNLSNRLRSFGLERTTVDGASVYAPAA